MSAYGKCKLGGTVEKPAARSFRFKIGRQPNHIVAALSERLWQPQVWENHRKTTAVLGARNGMPRQRRVRSTILPGNLQVHKALTERRYRRNRCIPFNGSLYVSLAAFEIGRQPIHVVAALSERLWQPQVWENHRKTTAVLGARNGMPRQRRVRSTILPGNLQVRKALTERRYISVCGRRSARKPATAKGEALGEPSKKPDGLMARPVHKSDHSTILRGCLQYIAKSYHNPSARG